MKQCLKKNFAKENLSDSKEELLQLQYFVKSDSGKDAEINVVISNPSQEDIEKSFTSLPEELEKLTELPLDQENICKIVLSYKLSTLNILYLLRSDGIPMSLQVSERNNY